METYYFTAACYTTLVKNLPNAEISDATGLVNWQKIIKSPPGIAYEQQAAAIVDAMMAAGIAAIEPGVRQCDAVAEIYRVMASGTPEFGREYSSIVPMLPTGEGTATPHLTWTDTPFKTGEATILELAGVRKRYNCPLARTVHPGKPPQKLADTEKVVVEGLNNAMSAARPRRSRRSGAAPSRLMASKRKRGSVIRPASTIRRTGVNPRCPSGLATRPCCRRTW